jgi:hypothetical protein
MGRFRAFGAAAPRGRIELLRHSWRLRHPSAGLRSFSLLQNVKEQGADAPLYYTLPCIDFNASKIIQSFLRGGEKGR